MSFWDDAWESTKTAVADKAGSYFNDYLSEWTNDSTPATAPVQQPSVGYQQGGGGIASGIAGFSWQTLASIATVLTVIIMLLRKK